MMTMLQSRTMARCIWFFLFLLPSAAALPFKSKPQAVRPPAQHRQAPVPVRQKKPSRFERFVDKVFTDADSNNDGTINFAETYELVLKLYVQINRQAPVPPPSRRVVHRLFEKSDIDRNNRVTREEFTSLANTLGRRAFTRLAAHKVMTLICAPLLAEYIVRKLTGKNWLTVLANFLVPDRWNERALPIITSRTFCRTILIIMFMMTLGNFIIGNVNWMLDNSLPEDKGDEERSFYT